MEDGTYHPRNRQLANKSFGKEVIRNIKKINNMKVSPTYYDEIFLLTDNGTCRHHAD